MGDLTECSDSCRRRQLDQKRVGSAGWAGCVGVDVGVGDLLVGQRALIVSSTRLG